MNKRGGSNKACSWDFFSTLKTVFVAGFSEINKRGGSNKACSWEKFLKKNKKKSMLIRHFRVHKIATLDKILSHCDLWYPHDVYCCCLTARKFLLDTYWMLLQLLVYVCDICRVAMDSNA